MASELPLYAQAALLDRYIHSPDPAANPGVLQIILEMLQSRQELRDLFFRSGPSAAWAEILWDQGFFAEPPTPKETARGSTLPLWDAQEYLISVASQVPDIVIKHIESVRGHGWYIGRAIEALCFIPASDVKGTLPKVINWLEDPKISQAIAQPSFELMKNLAKEGEFASALEIFRSLTAPLTASSAIKSGPYTFGGEAISKLAMTRGEDRVLNTGLELFSQKHSPQLVSLLEKNLCNALDLEADTIDRPNRRFSSGWRSAIEDTDQDLGHGYKHNLFRALREALKSWAEHDAENVRPLIERYLGEEREILRRLGLYLLWKYPAEFQLLVASELLNRENMDDVTVHHEFFLLLQEGYPYLPPAEQGALVEAICEGPPKERMAQLAQWAQEQRGADPDEYASRRTKIWVRDRLWMLRDHLAGQASAMLQELVDDLGTPAHPAFLAWSAGAHWVQDIGPITEQELSEMTPDELISFLRDWKPDPDPYLGLERVSYSGLARLLAKVVMANLDRYGDHLALIALMRPEYAYALLKRLEGGEEAKTLSWEVSLDLCERLLADDTVRQDMTEGDEGDWRGVRLAIASLLEMGLAYPDRPIPKELLPRARDILSILVDDPDPTLEDDQPQEDWFGHNDPATVAVNHVRPYALIALMEYARVHSLSAQEAEAGSETKEPGPKGLEPIVRQTLEDKLDRKEEPSLAVHSVFGRYLPLLYWLDREWLEPRLDSILPEEDDEDSVHFFVAAWDSFVIFNAVYLDLFDLLHSKYERAIYNLGKGYVTETHLEPQEKLGRHLIWAYMRSEYDVISPSGQQSLIALFFNQASPEDRGAAVWLLWRIVSENPSELGTYWPRARALWEWRMREASQLGHSVDFDSEMQWFAHLCQEAPDSETISSLWPLLEGLLPHITRHEQRFVGWESIEDYLAREVDRDPVKSIELYRLLNDQALQPRWFYPREEARKILETAAAHPDSREEALSLIDLLARKGLYDYRDIYDRYSM